MARPTMDDLPPELLVFILSHLKLKDVVLNCSAVSWKWNRASKACVLPCDKTLYETQTLKVYY